MRDRRRGGFARLARAAALLIAAGPAFADDPLDLEPTRAGSERGDCGLAVTPYGWFAAKSTDVGTTKLRQSFNDLASITNVGFQARVVVRWRWLLVASDWTYAELENEQLGPISVTQSIQQNILDLKLGSKVYDSRPADRGDGAASGSWRARAIGTTGSISSSSPSRSFPAQPSPGSP